MNRYRVEKSLSLADSMDGVKPLEEVGTDSLSEARKIMRNMADGGQFYACVVIAKDGEVVLQTADVV